MIYQKKQIYYNNVNFCDLDSNLFNSINLPLVYPENKKYTNVNILIESLEFYLKSYYYLTISGLVINNTGNFRIPLEYIDSNSLFEYYIHSLYGNSIKGQAFLFNKKIIELIYYSKTLSEENKDKMEQLIKNNKITCPQTGEEIVLIIE